MIVEGAEKVKDFLLVKITITLVIFLGAGRNLYKDGMMKWLISIDHLYHHSSKFYINPRTFSHLNTLIHELHNDCFAVQ